MICGSRHPLRLRGEDGVSLIETVLAMSIFLVVATGLAGMLGSATASHRLAREKTLAEQAAMDQVEYIRRLQYDRVGIVSGNPPGDIVATTAINKVGLLATMTTSVSYVNDPTPSSYATAANYKKIVVSIVRNRDSKELTREVTYVAPPERAPYGGIDNAILNVQVVDFGTSTPVPNVSVGLATGPSAPRNDVTDASGNLTFAALDPTNGSQPYYDVNITPPAGYTVLKEDVSPSSQAHFALAPTQTFNTALRIYKGATVGFSLSSAPTAPCAIPTTPFVNPTPVATVLHFSSPRATGTFNLSAGSTSLSNVTTFGGEKIPPLPASSPYTAGAFATLTCGNPTSKSYYWYGSAVAKTVPNAYPSDLTQSFPLTIKGPFCSSGCAAGGSPKQLTVQVKQGGVAVPNIRVTVQGGPENIFLTGLTDSTGKTAVLYTPATVPATCDGVTVLTSCYTITAYNPTGGATQLTNQTITANVTKTVNVP